MKVEGGIKGVKKGPSEGVAKFCKKNTWVKVEGGPQSALLPRTWK